MFSFASTLALLPLLAVASPQYNYGPAPGPSATTSTQAAAAAPSAPPSTSGQIDVGAGGNFVFSPANVTASNGTLVTFFFPDGGIPHSVTQGDFSNPCQPIAAQGGQNGFDSGLQMGTQFTLNVTNDQIPIYFFCKAPTHCGLGMVGSINAPSSGNTFDSWMQAALKVGSSEKTLQDNGPQTGGIGAVATAPPSASSAAASGSSSSGSSGSSGAMALTASSAVAAVFGLAVAMTLLA
ncbi:hypothetical protein BN946_scf184798.g6 [Trametes cinnabarina]|uniref:Blue (type 1) copper domain-containing protein n=1 Tax=Pycnoporus cinnabarinus TaxID=5643 RepID=A0A060S8W0_PYCCI|nr:hypothetical protein BN946_scf184798.g6 [Trametes cinnabarina]